MTALTSAGVTSSTVLGWADEMRVGLCSVLRRVWAPRGVKVRQLMHWTRQWRYLALVVNGVAGQLYWTWTENMKASSIATAVTTWQKKGVAAVVWDRAGSHRAAEVQAVGMTLVEQPPGAPEVNPAERVFEELRRAIEGRVYSSIEEKVAAVESALQELAAAPARVRQLAGWDWIHTTISALPSPPPTPADFIA